MQTFLDLISQYSIGEIIVFLVMLFLSFKQIVEFIDWVKGKIEKRDKKQLNQYQEEKDLYKEIEYFKEYVQQSQKYLSKMQEQIDLLIESDKDAIKAYITKEHHHFCYEQKWIDDYSLDKIPTRSEIETWITGLEIHRDVYSFRSRKTYGIDTIENLTNMGFFEQFENKIKSNNDEGVLPEINGIESIECLNCGTMLANDNGNSAIFDIQIQITYRNIQEEGGEVSQ